MSISIKLTEEEKILAEKYSKFHDISMDEAFKQAFFEKLEDEYDMAVSTKSYEEYLKSGKQSRPINELWEELGL